MKEIWKPVEGYEDLYEVSNYGRVKSISFRNRMATFSREKMLSPLKIRGYLRVSLCKNGKHKYFSIHRLVAEHFILNLENKPCVNHKDGDKHNNCVNNLEWCTYSENEQHSHKMLGKQPINKKKVNQYDLMGNFIKQFDSLAEAGKSLNRRYSLISTCCHGHINKAYGYKWQFVKECE